MGEGRAPKIAKKFQEEFPRPDNVGIRKVVLNGMISTAIPQSYKQQDVRAMQVQSAMQVAAMPLVGIVEGLKSGELKDKPDRVVQMAFSSLSMLSSANSQLNQVRREGIRPATKFKGMEDCCYH